MKEPVPHGLGIRILTGRHTGVALYWDNRCEKFTGPGLTLDISSDYKEKNEELKEEYKDLKRRHEAAIKSHETIEKTSDIYQDENRRLKKQIKDLTKQLKYKPVPVPPQDKSMAELLDFAVDHVFVKINYSPIIVEEDEYGGYFTNHYIPTETLLVCDVCKETMELSEGMTPRIILRFLGEHQGCEQIAFPRYRK